MSQEKLVQLMIEDAAKDGKKLDLGDPKQLFENFRREAKVRSKNPGIDEFETPSARPSVNRDETLKWLDQSKRFCVNREETGYVLGAKIPKQEPATGPVRVRYSFLKQTPAILFTLYDLISEWLVERNLQDTPFNRDTAHKFFMNVAQRRGMTVLDAGLLRLSDASYANYMRLVQP